MDLVDAVRRWWTQELPSETAALPDAEAFFREKASEIEQRTVVLQFNGHSKDRALETALNELLPTVVDLDDPNAAPETLELRAGDFVTGAFAYVEAEKRPSGRTASHRKSTGAADRLRGRELHQADERRDHGEIRMTMNAGPPAPLRPDATVWVVRAGSRGVDADTFVERGVIAIGAEAIDLSECDARTQIEAAVSAHVGEKTGHSAGNLHRFRNAIRVGDVAVVPVQSTRELLWGVVVGEYRYSPQAIPGSDPASQSRYHHSRAVSWSPHRRKRDDLPKSILYSLGGLLTVFQPSDQAELKAFLVDGTAGSRRSDPEPGEPSPDEDEASVGLSHADQANRNKELIQQHISRIGAYETQDLVAGILNALGYHTQVAPPGPDGGIDITAARDPLFIEQPVIKVQVKARGGSSGRPELQQLNGVMDPGDYGIFVSTGGFSGQAKAEARAFPRIQLWDMERLVDLLLAHYTNASPEVQALVPLARVWVLNEDG